MSHNSTPTTEASLDQFKRFCRQVSKTQETSDLINYVANDLVHINFCRDIVGPDQKLQEGFIEFCRSNRFDAEKIRERLCVVAPVLGVGKLVDYYKVLGVSPDADVQTIRKAYREKAPYFNPDKVDGSILKSDKYVDLHAAYIHLSDPILRRDYDQSVHNTGNRTIDQAQETEQAQKQEQKVNLFKKSNHGPMTFRMFNWVSFLAGVIACLVLVVIFNSYQKRSTSKFSQRSDAPMRGAPDTQLNAANEEIAMAEDGAKGHTPLMEKAVDSDGLKNQVADQPIAGSDLALTLSGNKEAIMFYSPRRARQYWVTEDSRHESFNDAIEYLARMYQRSSTWVIRYMGSENEVAAIHRNLIEQQAIETSADKTTADVLQARLPEPQQKDTHWTQMRTEVKPKAARRPTKKRKFPGKTKEKAVKKEKSGVANTATARSDIFSELEKKKLAAAIKQIDEQRIVAFLGNYTSAYKRKDLEQFQKYFTQDAVEMGKPFKTLLPTYQKTFDHVDGLKYQINLKTFSTDRVAKTINVNGTFSAKYRLPEKGWSSRFGTIRMELLDSSRGLLVRRLEYETK